MITGVDYIFYTQKELSAFFESFEKEMNSIWEKFYKEDDFEDGTYNVFYATNRQVFDEMDYKGFFLNERNEGTIYLIFNSEYSNKKNKITLVLPTLINESDFCKNIYEIVNKISQ
jgi:hypothetical protein